jgi:hypothetical protein
MSTVSAAVTPAAVPSAVLSLAEDYHAVAAIIPAPAARKRRRENEDDTDDARTTETETASAIATDDEVFLLPAPLVAAQPIVTVLPSRGGISSNKRPQLKYDPSVPMTREQTSAWRREQRRKRNRESAAACRRRQRELVSVLEVEVASWRHKFEHALAQVRTRDGEDAAAELEAELERTFVLQPRKTTEEDYGGRRDSPSPPPTRPFPDVTYSASTMIGHDATNIVSPSYDRSNERFLDEHHFMTTRDEDLHFPILEDHIKVKSTNFPGVNPQDQHPTVIKSRRAENRRHLNELITTSAEVKRLLRGALGDWTVDFMTCGGYGNLTQ